MKTFKNFAIALVATALVTTSCVDNVVSPQVEAIRTQQVEWMKAKVAAEAALTAMTNAEIAYKNAVTADQVSQTATAAALKAEELKQLQAINANKLLTDAEVLRNIKAVNAQAELTATITYNNLKAASDVTFAKAQTDIATQKTLLATATADLATAVANANSQEAASYLASYKAAAGDVSTHSQAKMDNLKTIADYNLAITFAGTKAALLTQTYTNQKTKEQANLAAHTAALAVYQAVATDPTSIQTQIDNLNKINYKYQASIDSLTLVIKNKTNEYNIKNTAFNTAQTTISDFTTLKYTTYVSQQNDSINREKTIVTYTTAVTTASADLASRNTDVTNKLGTYNDAKTTSDSKQATYNGLKTLSDAAYALLQTAINKTNNANADYQIANNNVTSTTTALANANADLTLANNNVTSANATLATRTANWTAASTALAANPTNITLITNEAIAKSQRDAAQTALTAAQAAQVTALSKQDAADKAKTAALAAQTTAKAPYDSAVTAQATAQKNYDIANAKTIDALSVYNTANTYTSTAKAAYDFAVNAVAIAQATLNSAKSTLVTAQNSFIIFKSTIQTTRDKINATTAAYNTALTTYASLNTAQQAANDEIIKLTAMKSEKSTLISYNDNIKLTLTAAKASATSVQNSIETEKVAIITINTTIAGLDNQIATLDITDLNGINTAKTYLSNEIAKLGKANEAIDVLIANANKLVTYYKGLLDKLLA